MTTNLTSRLLIIAIILGLSGLILWKGDVNLGIDLRGGTILTYKVKPIDDQGRDLSQTGPVEKQQVEDTVTVISQRINKEGVKDIQVRREGADLITIYLPGMTKDQSLEIRRRMQQVGELIMPIQAADGDRAYNVAFKQTEFDEKRKKDLQAHAADANNPPYVAPKGFRWFPTRPQRGEKEAEAGYRERVVEYEGKLKTAPWEVQGAWMYFDPQYWDPDQTGGAAGFGGRDIHTPIRSTDSRTGGPAVGYSVKEERQNDLAAYSSQFKNRLMALVLNNEIWSTATINGILSDHVQITGGTTGFTKPEQGWLINCLQAGSLKLRPELQSQDQIGATLGAKSIDRGFLAFAIGGAAILLFMLLYYRSSGLIAIIALTCNFVMIMGVLILLDASLTLPGIAGLILTIGMAVDANILIFERIREEIAKGKTPMQAAKNGFDRAFVTIFDANLTTFIVAAFLVSYGKGPIKGFGYTLMTGIACSMFSALFITRTLMGAVMKRGGLKEIVYAQIVRKTSIRFSQKVRFSSIASFLVIAGGLALFFSTPDETKFGLDFNGGTSVRMMFREPMADSDVRDTVAGIVKEDGGQKYKFPEATSIDPVDGMSTLVELKLDYVVAGSEDPSADGTDEFKQIESELQQAFSGKLAAPALEQITYEPATQRWAATLNLLQPYDDIEVLTRYATDSGIAGASITPVGANAMAYKIVGTSTPEIQSSVAHNYSLALSKIDGIELSNPFPKVRFLGPNVVDGLKASAIKAMIVSLLFILGYIWFRFKELKYGFAAAGALVHDVLISLGVVVGMNLSGLVSVPISLNVIAAFLTIIGYSLNDTIVVFDRIRENMGSVKGSFDEVVDRSLNATLSRTVLTSVTTFAVIGIVFVSNYGIESPLEGLAFTLMIGVVVGTYSSIFIASPILIWLHNREEANASKPRATGHPNVAKA